MIIVYNIYKYAYKKIYVMMYSITSTNVVTNVKKKYFYFLEYVVKRNVNF